MVRLRSLQNDRLNSSIELREGVKKNLSINETESMNGGQSTPHQANGVNTSNSNIKHFKSDDGGDLNQDV